MRGAGGGRLGSSAARRRRGRANGVTGRVWACEGAREDGSRPLDPSPRMPNNFYVAFIHFFVLKNIVNTPLRFKKKVNCHL
jgi:hypothetical protein